MSGIDLEARLVETASEVATTRNSAGDRIYGTSGSRRCLYRDASTLNEISNREDVTIDGLLWFSPLDGDVLKGAVYYHPSEGYLKIQQVTRAKRLVADNALKFIRCTVTKQGQVS